MEMMSHLLCMMQAITFLMFNMAITVLPKAVCCVSVLFTELSHHVLVVVGASTCTRLCMLVT